MYYLYKNYDKDRGPFLNKVSKDFLKNCTEILFQPLEHINSFGYKSLLYMARKNNLNPIKT